MPITRIPPQRAIPLTTQLDISAPARVARSQAAVGDANDRLAQVGLQNMLQVLDALAKQKKPDEDNALLTNAKLNAKLAAAQGAQQRLQTTFDENGNPTFTTLPTDLADITAQAYQQAGAGLPERLQKQWTLTTRSASVGAQIRGLGAQASQREDFIQTQVGRQQQVAQGEAAGDLSKNIETIISENNAGLDALRGIGGDASTIDNRKRNDTRRLYEERFNALLRQDPTTAQQFIGQMQGFNDNETAKLYDRVDARFKQIQQHQNAQDSKVINFLNEQTKKGLRVDPDIIDKVKGISQTNSDVRSDANSALILHESVSDFKQASDSAQDRVIQNLRSLEQTPGSAKLLDVLESHVKTTREARTKDPTGFAIENGLGRDLGVLDPSQELLPQIQQRHQLSQELGDQHGLAASGFTRLDMKALTDHYTQSNDTERMEIVSSLVAEYGPDSRVLFGQILNQKNTLSGDDKATHLAMVGMLTIHEQADSAESLIQGRRLRENKDVALPTKQEFLTYIQDEGLLANGLTAATRSAKINAIMDTYALLSHESGDFSNEAGIDSDRMDKAAEMVNMGGLIEVDSPTSQDHFIESPDGKITTEAQFENWVKVLDDDVYSQLGGIKGVDEDPAVWMDEKLKNGDIFFVSVGNGRYQIQYRIPEAGDTENPFVETKHGGPVNPGGTRTANVLDKNGELFVLDYGLVQDIRSGINRPSENKKPSMTIDQEASEFFRNVHNNADKINKALTTTIPEENIPDATPAPSAEVTDSAGPDPVQQTTRREKETVASSKSIGTQQLLSDNKRFGFSEKLAANTKKWDHVGYKLGAKNVRSGVIDCSGWTHYNTTKAAQGHPAAAKINKLMNTYAAAQIHNIGAIVGITPDAAIRKGQIEPGMIIGIKRANPPGWARNRSRQISHVVQIVTDNGRLMVSESGSGGVKMRPFATWLATQKNTTLYATNPFKVR